MSDKFKIPKSITVMSTVYKIEIVDKIEDPDVGHCYGLCNKTEHVISIAKTFRGTKVLKGDMEITYLHELIHAILFAMGEHKLNGKEKFVEGFSGLLHQVMQTSKY